MALWGLYAIMIGFGLIGLANIVILLIAVIVQFFEEADKVDFILGWLTLLGFITSTILLFLL